MGRLILAISGLYFVGKLIVGECATFPYAVLLGKRSAEIVFDLSRGL